VCHTILRTRHIPTPELLNAIAAHAFDLFHRIFILATLRRTDHTFESITHIF
jgi:hypothetical protein